MVIQHNISAINAHRTMGLNNSGVSKNLEKLSSGFKINRAGDDAAGLAISEKMRGQIRGLAMAEQNSQNGISLIQTAEGGLNETHAILQRMRELAVQSSNGTYQDEDREQLTKEFEALKSEVDRIAESTHYNGIKLLNGNLDEGFDITKTLAGSDFANAASGAGFIAGDVGTATGFTVTVDDTGAATVTVNGGALNGSAAASATYNSSTGEITLKLESATTPATNYNTITFKTTANPDDGEISFDLSLAADATVALGSGSQTTGTGGDLVFQIGANGGDDQRVYLSVASMDSKNIGLKEGDLKSDGTKASAAEAATLSTASIGTVEGANKAIDIIHAATNAVSGQRAELGALQNRLEHTLNNLGVTKENLTAAESSIRDVDMAKEMMEFTKNNILVQASQAMLAQANQLPQGVLQLLR